MTKFLLNAAKNLVARVKRVIFSGSLIMFSDEHMSIVRALAVSNKAIDELHSRLALQVEIYDLQRTRLNIAQEALREATLGAEESTRTLTEAREKLVASIRSIVDITSRGAAPNGTTIKIKRIAEGALA